MKEPKLKISDEQIRRSVATSTAIETGQPVTQIEAKLKDPNPVFDKLKLAD